nr:GNAT family N-acetyltransferase [uncultured Chitinophaga sp.]
METMTIRTITPADNPTLANIIRTSLAEFGMDRPGTVYTDPTTDHLSDIYSKPRATYFVAEENGVILGGAGVHPLDGGEAHVCELQKMYLVPAARGKGLAGKLITLCLEYAKANGYTHCYLETDPQLARARQVYEQFGFRYLTGPMGSTGHFGCDSWMLKDL